MKSKIESNLKLIMYWFELLMFFVAYITLAALLAGKGLEWLQVILFIWFIIYLAGKIWFFKTGVLNK